MSTQSNEQNNSHYVDNLQLPCDDLILSQTKDPLSFTKHACVPGGRIFDSFTESSKGALCGTYVSGVTENNIILESESTFGTRESPTIGGPPVPGIPMLQATGCTEGDIALYKQVDHAINCAIVKDGSNVTSLGKSIVLTDIASKPPISCMIDLMTGPYVDCGAKIPNDKRKDAYNAFTEVTGLKPINLNNVLTNLNNQQKNILKFNAFYIFFPLFLLSVVAIWLMVGFSWFDWAVGMFLMGLIFIVLYGFSILYRMHAQSYLNDQNTILQNDATNAQNNFENSVAYWPQGLFATACAVTAPTGGTGWICNETQDCQSCHKTQNINSKSQACCSSNLKDKTQQYETEINSGSNLGERSSSGNDREQSSLCKRNTVDTLQNSRLDRVPRVSRRQRNQRQGKNAI